MTATITIDGIRATVTDGVWSSEDPFIAGALNRKEEVLNNMYGNPAPVLMHNPDGYSAGRMKGAMREFTVVIEHVDEVEEPPDDGVTVYG